MAAARLGAAGLCAALVLAGASAASTAPRASAAGMASAAAQKTPGAMTAPRPAAVGDTAVLGQWGNAAPMPGAAALSSGNTSIWTVSCASTGDCVLGGNYDDAHGNGQAFVASGHNGTWGNAIKLPGTVGVTTNGGNSEVDSVSCAPAGGYCVAGGFLAKTFADGRAFVSADINGIWGQPTPIPGLENIKSQVQAVSCSSPGNCAAGGWFQAVGHGPIQPFVADEENGTWGQFTDLGITRLGLNTGGAAEVDSASCSAPGNCVISGEFLGPRGWEAFWGQEGNRRWLLIQTSPFLIDPSAGSAVSCTEVGFACTGVGQQTDVSGHEQAYAMQVFQGGGTAGPQTIPGAAALNAGGNAEGSAVSCTTPGNCVTGGFYTDQVGQQQVFVAEEKNSTWGTAITLPGSTALNAVGPARIQNVSCPTAGNCAVSGFYTDANGNEQILVADETNGIWSSAMKLPGATSTGNNAGAHVACWAPVHCTAVGAVTTSGHLSAIAATESPSTSPVVLGHWATAAPVPGVAALSKGQSTTTALSCAPSADCAIAGSYTDRFGKPQAWVADGHAGAWGTAIALPGATDATSDGGKSEIKAASCVTGVFCAVAGDLWTSSSIQSERAMVAADHQGAWGTATIIPGLENSISAALTVSCASVGNCVAGGWYLDSAGNQQAFVANDVNGTWQQFSNVANLMSTPDTGGTQTSAVSCPAAGQCVATGTVTAPQQQWVSVENSGNEWENNTQIGIFAPGNVRLPSQAIALSCSTQVDCAAIGTFVDADGQTQPYIEEQAPPLGGPTNGWNLPIQIPNMSLIAAGGFASPQAVSCPAPGFCAVTGTYLDGSDHQQAFVADERGGTWGNAIPVPGIVALNAGNAAGGQAVSCVSPGNCTVTGFYTDASRNEQFLVLDEVNGIWGTATHLASSAAQGEVGQDFASCWTAENCVTAGAMGAPGSLQAVASVESPGASAALKTSAATVEFGKEQAARLTVSVTPKTGGIPAGKVTIKAGGTALGSVSLSKGKGTFTLPAKRLAPGTYQLTATYTSSNGYRGVTSGQRKLTVTKPAASAVLSLATAKVRFGHEQAEHLSVTVTSPAGGTPAGTVTIKAGGSTLATVTLRSGKAAWTLPASRLAPGTYQLTASYASSNGYQPATSASRTLTVTT
jgi:Bacterial Ig-like domain (group 3)